MRGWRWAEGREMRRWVSSQPWMWQRCLHLSVPVQCRRKCTLILAIKEQIVRGGTPAQTAAQYRQKARVGEKKRRIVWFTKKATLVLSPVWTGLVSPERERCFAGAYFVISMQSEYRKSWKLLNPIQTAIVWWGQKVFWTFKGVRLWFSCHPNPECLFFSQTSAYMEACLCH